MDYDELRRVAQDLTNAMYDLECLAQMFGDRWPHVVKNARAHREKREARASQRKFEEWAARRWERQRSPEAAAASGDESQLAGMTVTMLADGQSVEMTGEQFEAGLDRIASMTPEEIAAFSDDEAPGVQFTEHAAAGGGAE